MRSSSTDPSALFLADLHLKPEEPAIFARFLAFLNGPARQTRQLFILGDLFDSWAGDDDLTDPFNAQIVAALRSLADSGIGVAFMAGNRDFLIGARFAAAAGIELLPEPCVREIAGVPTLLMHGDTLCTDDADYQRFRAMVRDPAWQAAFLARPLAERKREIAAMRARSEMAKRSKPLTIMDISPSAVAEALRHYGTDVLIHGHIHREGRYLHPVDGRDCIRWALGDWRPERASVLSYTNSSGWMMEHGIELPA